MVFGGSRRRIEWFQISHRIVSKSVVVNQIIGIRRTIAVVESLLGIKIAANSYLHRVLDGQNSSHKIRRSSHPVCNSYSSRIGIGIFYLRGRRYSCLPILCIKPDIAGHQRNKVGAGAAHDELVMIVADCVIVSQVLEYRRITGIYIKETHGFSALEGMARYRSARKIVLAADARSNINPSKKIVFAFICLLPHLEKTMWRIAEIRSDRAHLYW